MSLELPLDLIFDSENTSYTDPEQVVNKLKSAIRPGNRVKIEVYGKDSLYAWHVGAHITNGCPILVCRVDDIRAKKVNLNQKGIKIYKEK